MSDMIRASVRATFLFFFSSVCLLSLFSQESLLEKPTIESDAKRGIVALSDQAIGILKQRCLPCHGPDKAENGLRLDSREYLLAGGERGEPIRFDNHGSVEANSLLLRSILSVGEGISMPPEIPLPENEKRILEEWITGGCNWPEEVGEKEDWVMGLTESDAASFFQADVWSDLDNPIRRVFSDERWNHWSYLPRKDFEIPAVTDGEWSLNPIDRFLLAEWGARQLPPAPELDRRQWLRRLSFDLIGLPPSWEEVESFLHDKSNDAYEKQVERLLYHPGHGEHWARMWLDVVRYSDSNGFDWDEFRPEAWRYRDYVIDAFRNDKPFDRFVLEQLAGDEIFDGAPKNIDEQSAWIASGYLRLGPHDNAAPLFNEQDRSRDEWMTDLVETTGTAFLGLTLSCCRCHDHKTDPLLQADHYRLRAFFAGVSFADSVPIDVVDEYNEITNRRAKLEVRIDQLNREIERLDKLESVELEEQDKNAIKKAIQKLLTKLQSEMPIYTHALAVHDQSEIADTYILSQGDYRKPMRKVSPGYPAIWQPLRASVEKVERSQSSGRRTALAQWIVHRENPLTARVIVNRIWQNYFGEGLVGTPNDFGVTGDLPKNRQLLDWLACELVQANWSLRHIHRLITTSRAYRLRAVAEVAGELEWGSPRRELRRLTAEQLRDAILSVSGQLIQKSGGPAIWPELPPEVLNANPALLDDNETKTKGWYPSPQEQQSVRSIYLVQKRTVPIPYMETFDLPENSVSCGRRLRSIVAPQALTLLNGEMMEQASLSLASRSESPEADRVIEIIFERALQRKPSGVEREHCLAFLKEFGASALSRVVLNSNEFLFLD